MKGIDKNCHIPKTVLDRTKVIIADQ